VAALAQDAFARPFGAFGRIPHPVDFGLFLFIWQHDDLYDILYEVTLLILNYKIFK